MTSEARQRAMQKFKENNPSYFADHWKNYYAKNAEKIRENRRKRYAENLEREKQYTRTHYKENREEILKKQKASKRRKEYFKQYYIELKKRVIAAYGGKCVCCSCAVFEFLTIDHIHGDGRKDRAVHRGAGFYSWLEKNGFPTAHYRLLCMNCNFAIGIYGACPHATESSPVSSLPLQSSVATA
jgi:hypothetical protein